MRRTRLHVALAGVLLVTLGVASYAVAGDGGKKRVKSEQLSGYNEVPAVSTTGKGSFKADIDVPGQKITYELEFSGLSGNPSAAHIHFAQRDVNGGVVAFLCGGGTKPACPAATSGTVKGTVLASDIMAAQGLDTFPELVAAIRVGRTYVNMHTAANPGGEIRAQLNNRNRR